MELYIDIFAIYLVGTVVVGFIAGLSGYFFDSTGDINNRAVIISFFSWLSILVLIMAFVIFIFAAFGEYLKDKHEERRNRSKV